MTNNRDSKLKSVISNLGLIQTGHFFAHVNSLISEVNNTVQDI